MTISADGSKVSRPALRYHGGKWRLAPWILQFFPARRYYVEPFCGAASLLLRKERSYAEVINDMDEGIVNLFQVLRDPSRAKDLINTVKLTPFSRKEFETAYVACDDSIERARRMLVRAFMGFSSAGGLGRPTGFRANVTRSNTTPSHDWAGMPRALEDIVERLGGVVIENRPALAVIDSYDFPGTLLYCDPPYVHETRSHGNRHCVKHRYKFEMSDEEHRELAERLNRFSGMVVISGYDCPLYAEMYEGWGFRSRLAMADGARRRVECLWINAATEKALSQRNLEFGDAR